MTAFDPALVDFDLFAAPPPRPGFGHPGSIGPGLTRLPEAMQAEGLRLLAEMGAGPVEAARCVGMSVAEAARLLTARHPLIHGAVLAAEDR